jgi:hypothetical protein|tara:strand:+ start:59 stop:262 length:204 start_codon:yes stop_codon:yes gene_type:complete
MINFILTITVLLVWVGAVYLYFLFDRLLDDVRTINEDLQELKDLCKKKLTQDSPQSGDVPDDEFLGI